MESMLKYGRPSVLFNSAWSSEKVGGLVSSSGLVWPCCDLLKWKLYNFFRSGPLFWVFFFEKKAGPLTKCCWYLLSYPKDHWTLQWKGLILYSRGRRGMCYSYGDFLAYQLGIHDWNAAMTAPTAIQIHAGRVHQCEFVESSTASR